MPKFDIRVRNVTTFERYTQSFFLNNPLEECLSFCIYVIKLPGFQNKRLSFNLDIPINMQDSQILLNFPYQEIKAGSKYRVYYKNRPMGVGYSENESDGLAYMPLNLLQSCLQKLLSVRGMKFFRLLEFSRKRSVSLVILRSIKPLCWSSHNCRKFRSKFLIYQSCALDGKSTRKIFYCWTFRR